MKKRNLTAMAMAAMMIMANVSPAMMAMAEETVSSSGSSTGSTTQADNNFAAKNDKTIHDTVELVESSEKDSNKKEIDSDIVAGDAGVIAEGDHSYGIMAFPSENGNSSANVHVTGSVTVDSEYGRGISAVGNGSIIVDKDVISSGTGVMAYDGMKVEIGGDVKSGSTNSGIYIDGGSSVTVHGNVSGYRGVIVDTTITNEIPDDVDGIIEVLSTGEKQAMVVIEGDLQSDAKQAIILSGSEGKVIVKGDVSAAKDTPVRIYADYNGKFGEKESEITAGNSEIAIGGTLLIKMREQCWM